MEKKWLFVLIVLAMLFSNCTKDPAAVTYEIYYTVTGAGENANISYDIGGVDEHLNTNLPYTTMDVMILFHAGDEPSINAYYSTYSGPITVNIYKDGALWKTATSAAGSPAQVSGVL